MISNPNELLLLNLINNKKNVKNKLKNKVKIIKEKVKKNKLYICYIKFLKVYLPISSIAKLIWDIIMVANYSNGGYLFLI